MTEPKNVTPGAPEPRGWQGFNWTWDGRGSNVPWLGILLVLVGVGLLIQYFVPGVSAGTIVLLALGIVLLASWLISRSRWAVVPGLLILALGVAGLLREVGHFDGVGVTPLALAVAFALIWLLDLMRGVRSTWPLWGVAIFGLIGLVQVSSRIDLPQVAGLGALWPVLIIVVGVLLLISARRRNTPHP
jgi:hypothetical protein